MAQLTHDQYDALERAISRGSRIAIYRRGAELVVVPIRLRAEGGRETLEATHPTTGEPVTWHIDEIDGFEVVR